MWLHTFETKNSWAKEWTNAFKDIKGW